MEVHIISGFMGAGKTTFLNRYLPLLTGKTAVIVNDDGNVKLREDIFSERFTVKYMTTGCICCTLINDFREIIRRIAEEAAPEQVVIEAAGIGKLSDVEQACQSLLGQGVELEVTKKITLIDLPEHDMYACGLGEFYLDQVRSADIILPGHMEGMTAEEKQEALAMLEAENPGAAIYRDDYRELSDEELNKLVGNSRK